ncbi:glyoxalase [Rhodophyticola sp. CCM32]|uniref:VOC family protein n=1 Tax=Rhodophyticola sp. CCM32 TaxID=2916397 RepID=UPI00107EF791|nr:VOC family protein [Rhodophyticola sp. CCM32]QBY02501.1 glyoxalase [Rhodophyticola sp. CCM32]
MTVRRIIANIELGQPGAVRAFYADLFGLETLMDQGWIVTLGSGATQPVQISFASEGGSGTPVPGLSIEVDDLDTVLARAAALGIKPHYGPVVEPWGVRRAFLTDPAGTVLNVLEHTGVDPARSADLEID